MGLSPILVAILVSLCAGQAVGQPPIWFASYYGSHMVLHRAPRQAAVWGYTDVAYIGQKVRVTLQGGTGKAPPMEVTVKSDSNSVAGTWSVTLPATEAGGPYIIEAIIVTTQESAEIGDVFFGDVWFCAGQSNMALPVQATFNNTEEIEGSIFYPEVRLLKLAQVWSDHPQDEVDLSLIWSRPQPGTVAPFGSACWSYARKVHEYMKIPIGIIQSTWGGTRIEPWSSPDALRKCGDIPRIGRGPNKPSNLWNSMVRPLIRMTITGVIWYQGETNADAFENTYDCYFKAMIDDWRLKFKEGTNRQTDPMMPFGFVQISTENPDMSVIGGFPSLRWMQTARFGYAPNSKMPRTFMAVSMDLEDFESPGGNNHPRDKTTITSRLLLGMRAVWLGERVKHAGPMPTAYRLDDTTIRPTLELRIGNQQSPITVRSEFGFELCCASRHDEPCAENDWRWKAGRIIRQTPNSVVLGTEFCEGTEIVAHRYSWRATPCLYKRCAIYSMENELPAPPYVKYGLLINDGEWHSINFEE